MFARDFLTRAQTLPLAPIEELTAGTGIVVVAPHPDDETFGCAGLIRAAIVKDIPVRIVVLTDGAGSHPQSAQFPPMRLRALRQEETRRAMSALGVPPAQIFFMGLPDGGLAVEGPQADAAARKIAATAQEIDAGAMFVTWEHDPHRDHRAAFHIVSRGPIQFGRKVRLYQYMIWGWTLSDTVNLAEPPRGVRLDIAPWLDAKLRAMAAHASQVTRLIDDDPCGFPLPEDMLARFRLPIETFLRASIVG